MQERKLSCSQCGSRDRQHRHLGVYGSSWRVMFGSKLFDKQEILAYACGGCDLVSLHLRKGSNDVSTAKSGG